MTLVNCTLLFNISGAGDLDSATDKLADELFALEECHENLRDCAVAVDLKKREVEISVTVEHTDEDEAVSIAMSSIRSVIHGSGGHTPDWPGVEFHRKSLVSEPVFA